MFCSVCLYVFMYFAEFVCMFSGVLQCLYVFGRFVVFVCMFTGVLQYLIVCLWCFAVFNCICVLQCLFHIVFSSSSAVSTFFECGLFFFLRAQ